MSFNLVLQNYFVRLVLFLIIYLVFARAGLALATINETASPVWPATGISFAILFLFGLKYWPAIALGVLITNLSSSIPMSAIIAIVGGNTIEALIGAVIMLFFSQKKYLSSPHVRTIAIVSASLIASSISAMVGTLALILSGASGGDMFDTIWITWWTGDVLGGMMILPLIFSFTKNIFNDYDLKIEKVNKSMMLAVLVTGSFLCWLLFIRPEGAPYLFFIFPFLLWCAAQTGERGVAVSTIVISAIGITSVKLGYGVFIHGTTNANLVNLQLFLGSVAVCSLMMSDLKRMSSLKQPGMILFFSLLFAGLLFLGFFFKSNKDADDHLKLIVEGVEPMMQARMNMYFAALQSGAGLFAASDNVTREEWRAFLENDSFIKKELQGVASVGVIFRVQKDDLERFVIEKGLTKNGGFSYKVVENISEEQQLQNKQRKEAYLLTFVEPMENGRARIGLDLATEEQRRYYAELARDTGIPTVTGRVQLAEDIHRTPVMLFFYPFYGKGDLPENVSARRERLIGWIYSPVVIEDFFANIFSEGNFKEMSYNISDEFNGHKNTIAASHDYELLPVANEMTKKIRLGNHDFVFKFKGSAAFYSSQDAFSSWVGAIAALISLLLGTLIASLQAVKRRALSIVSQTTEELRASEELWKFALEGAGDSVWDWDIPTGKAVVTSRFKLLLGYSEYEIKDEYTEWEVRIHPDDFHRVTADIRAHFKGQANFVTECRLRCKNGEYKWVLARGMIVSHYLGKPRRMVGTIADISTRKEIEHEMERQRAKLNSVFEGSSDALILLSEDGFFDCNYKTLKMFGLYSKEEFISLMPEDFSPEFQPDGSDSLSKSREHIRRAFENGVNQFEWIHCKKNGKLFPAEIILTAFDYDGKKVLQACLRDITERKQAEAIVISQREKLVASAKMSSLGEMAGGIAHEINNPLTIIIGKTSLLKRRLEFDHNAVDVDKLTHSISDELTNIQVTAKRIGSIIRGLRSFSRNAENDLMEKVEVSTLINETLEFSRERFKFHSIDLKVNMDKDEHIFVNGRAAQLLQVLVNLLNNAYDAVESLNDRWVELKVQRTDHNCKISITDSGEGIDPVVVEKIMMPFFTTKEVGKGTGLGLSISKGIIEDHKGKLYYDMTNANTCFVIELPEA